MGTDKEGKNIMQETENIKLQKPSENEYINLQTLNDNADKVDAEFGKVENPPFDDSGTVQEISSFTDFVNSVKTKMNIFQFFRDFKAGMKYVLHAGRLANNAVTTEEGFALDARMGKVLQDQILDVNKNIGNTVFTDIKADHSAGNLFNIIDQYFQVSKKNIMFGVSNSVDGIPSNSYYTIKCIHHNYYNEMHILAYATWENIVYTCNYNVNTKVATEWRKVVTNNDLPIFQSFIVDPQGSDRIVLTLTNNADSGKVFATNGDVSAFNGYIKGVQIEHNTNKLTVFLSENRTGNIRINVMYMKL